VLVHVPPGHHTSSFGRARAAWLRARVVESRPDQPSYSASPVLHAAEAAVLGGTVTAVHADRVLGETVGTSEGVAGQRFPLQHAPVVPGDDPVVVEVAEPQATGATAWTAWQVVGDFGDSGAEDRHVVLEQRTGELVFGPVVREPEGGVRQLGRVPQAGAAVRVREYRTGGGAHGNVGPGTLVVLTTSLPYVSEVVNRRAAAGGRDAEDVEEAKARGPVVLRHRGRAVTAEDFEHLARAAAPEVARVRAVPAGDGADAGAVRVLVVPAVPPRGRLEFGQLVPDPLTLQRIADALDGVRLLTTRVVVEPPSYQGVTVVARVRAAARHQPRVVEAAVHAALERWFSPVSGGPDGKGWPFGRTVHVGEVYGLLQAVEGVDLVEDTRLYAADPVSGARGDAAQRIELDGNALVFSFEHQVRVLAPGAPS
jgi:predicted phage baseplate assembly protein